jgi:hypothetical protein
MQDSPDGQKRDETLKRMLGTLPKPHEDKNKQPSARRDAAKKGQKETDKERD